MSSRSIASDTTGTLHGHLGRRGLIHRVLRSGGLASLVSGCAALLLAGCASVLLAGCASVGGEMPRPQPYTDPLPPPAGMDGVPAAIASQPADVWIQPVVDASSGRGAPVGALRDELYRGLVARLYTPIALVWGDAQLAEASASTGGFPTGAMGAEAVLEVRVLSWDASSIERSGSVFAELEARLIDPRTTPATQLWGRRLARELSVDKSRLRQSTTGELEELAIRNLGREVLGLMPQRDPVRAASQG
ncbi:hypothetical protein [Engelhardtia mirabilis]|uniref:ABC-type transport auxiliary lipoprotein component domain-containing protein n=1 Tax=Engelhardtia mirabilis TaxID=2528011 RepID=A0A518BPW4_9BACT|nr:hypothetical protein Pla133_41220 [Planctomycetes bacterium Pla133]QDV03333.1 hypothetical protein Pla86_41210 [Planctomycetes bacterium Pla86]